MKVVSIRDELELADAAVIIRKQGLANALASGMNGERSIDVTQITGITFKKGGMFTPGFIQFSYAGSKPFMGGLIEATQDPDAFVFGKELNDQVQALKVALEERIRVIRDTRPATTVEGDGLADQLGKLADLRAAGVLTDDEFQRAKDKLLDSAGS